VNRRAGILSVGARTPYGLDALQSVMVWRSGKVAPTPTAWLDKRGRKIGSVRSRALDEECVGTERLLELAAPALREAVGAAGPRVTGAPIVLATGEARAGFEGAASPELAARIAHAAGFEVDAARSSVVCAGHASFGIALAQGLALLEARRGPVVVGAVDSYHHPAALEELDQGCRLLAEEAEDGLIPSEGAAFVVLSHEGIAAARVASVASMLEEEGEDSTDIAVALTEVIRRASEGWSIAPRAMPWVLTDTNGERHRVRRWSFVRVRERDRLSEDDTEYTDGPDDYGDAGAAMGALLAVRAVVSFASGATTREAALVALSSEGPARAAFVLEAAS
jgi:3-oxoacyl-[acyl-carrier-protein] synthase I